MRDPQRIDRILSQFQTAWQAFPDMRLGQLVLNITRAENTSALWNLEDAQLEQLLAAFTTSKICPEGLRYVKRRWNETRSHKHANFGHSWWYFEIDPNCHVIRHLELYDNGTILGYHPQKPKDTFGFLSIEPLEKSLLDFEFTTAAEFNEIWLRRTNA